MRAPLSVGNLPQKKSRFSHGLPSLKQKQQVHENRARQKGKRKSIPTIAFSGATVDGRNPAPVDRYRFFLISGGYLGFLPSAIS